MNKKFVYQVGNNKKIYYDARLTKYQGFILSENGVAGSADKVKAVREYPTPKNAKDIRAFLRLASFYRRLVPKFVKAAKPLTILTRNDQKFTWGPSKEEAYDDFKNTLSIFPVLTYPNFEIPLSSQQMPLGWHLRPSYPKSKMG